MRFQGRRLVTLEEDILHVWGLHGWDVVTETVRKNTWIIKAKLIPPKQKRKV